MSRLLQAARGKACTLRLIPHCNGDPATVVACHLPYGHRGIGIKAPDWWSVYGCHGCHDVIDGRVKTELTREEVAIAMLRALFETTRDRMDEALLAEVGRRRR